MARQQDGAARGFIATTALHADIAVFHFVQAADAVLATQGVQVGQHLGGAHAHTVNRHHVAVFVGQLNDLGFVGRFFRTDRQAPHAVVGRVIGVFQDAAFIADVQQVGVHGIGWGSFALGTVHRNAVLVGVAHEFFAGEQIPFTPGRNDLHIGHQGVSAQLETHLVVAFASRAMADGVGLGFAGDLHQTLGDQGAGNRGAQEVFAFVQCIGAEHGEHKVTHKLFAQVFNEDVAGLDAHLDGFGTCWLYFLALANVGGEGDHLAVVLVLQPFQDDGGVQTARVGENNALGGIGFAGGGPFGGHGVGCVKAKPRF